MRKRLVFAAFCILAFPLLFSLPQTNESTNPTPFSSVALAGRTLTGSWCQCGCYGCICDEGEQGMLCGQSADAVSDEYGDSSGQIAQPADVDPSLGFDFASGALMIALAFFVWARLRA